MTFTLWPIQGYHVRKLNHFRITYGLIRYLYAYTSQMFPLMWQVNNEMKQKEVKMLNEESWQMTNNKTICQGDQ